MTISTRKERERQARRSHFVEVATALFSERGVEATSIEDIARTAEFSKRTVYLYYENKRDLFAAVVLKAIEHLHETLDRALETKGSNLDRLEAVAWAYFRFFREERRAFDLIQEFEAGSYHYGKAHSGKGAHARACGERIGAFDERLYAIWQRAIDDGSVKSELSPPQLHLLVSGQIVGVLRAIAMREQILDSHYSIAEEDFYRAFLRQLRASLTAGEGERR